MKKYFLLFLVILTSIFSLSAKAKGLKNHFYTGASINYLEAETKYRDKSNLGSEASGKKKHEEAIKYGVNSGYNFYFNKFFIAPEVFYDKMDILVQDIDARVSIEYGGSLEDGLKLNQRIGYKINIGHRINRFAFFGSVGQAKVWWSDKYTTCQPGDEGCLWSANKSLSNRGSKIAMIYGFGATYEMLQHLALRIDFDYQHFNLGRHRNVSLFPNSDFQINKVTIKTAKLGLIYRF